MMKDDELMTACLQELKKPRESSDADTIFGKYIANQLSKIPEEYAKEMLKLGSEQSIMRVMISTPQPMEPAFSGNHLICMIMAWNFKHLYL